MIDINIFKDNLGLLGLQKSQEDVIIAISDRAIAAEEKVLELAHEIEALVGKNDALRESEGVAIGKLYDAEKKLAELDKQPSLGYIYSENMRHLNNIGAATIYKERQEFKLSVPQKEYELYLHAKPVINENNPPVEWQYKRRDGSWKSFENEKHRDDTMADGGYDIRPLYAEAAPVTHITITDKPMFQAAVSGLWYESPEACGKVIAVTFGAKHYKLPGIEQEAHCKRCGDVGEISAHVPMTMADFENVACPDCSNVENSDHIVGNIQEQANVIRSPNGWFEETISLYRSKNKSSLPTDIGDLNILANSGNADRLWRKFKDHEIAHIVNEVRDIAVEFGQAQQLRARIADVLVPALHSVAEPIEWESTTEAYKKYITDSQYKKLKPEFQKWYKPFSVLLASPADAKPKESVEPFAWVFEKSACRAPDDCEDYLEIIELDKVNKDELDKHLKHGRAFPLYRETEAAKPQRITEQDTRKIVFEFTQWRCEWNDVAKEECNNFFKNINITALLTKLNEHREPEFKPDKPDYWIGKTVISNGEFILYENPSQDDIERFNAFPVYRTQVTANKAEVPSKNEDISSLRQIGTWNQNDTACGAIYWGDSFFRQSFSHGAPVYVSTIEPIKDGAQ